MIGMYWLIGALLPLALILSVPWYNIGKDFISYDPFEFDFFKLISLTIGYAIFFGIIWLWYYLMKRFVDKDVKK